MTLEIRVEGEIAIATIMKRAANSPVGEATVPDLAPSDNNPIVIGIEGNASNNHKI